MVSKNLALLVLLSLGVSIGLAESYLILQQWTSLPLWASATGIHSLIALGFWLFFRRKTLTEVVPQALLGLPQLPSYIWYLPATLVLLFGLGILAVQEFFASHTSFAEGLSPEQILSVLWIPLLEEVLFRKYLGNIFRRLALRPFLGIYFSSLSFSWLHSIPSLERILLGETGIYIGPLLLALCCEILYIYSRRLLPGILLHAACNACVVLFAFSYLHFQTPT